MAAVATRTSTTNSPHMGNKSMSSSPRNTRGTRNDSGMLSPSHPFNAPLYAREYNDIATKLQALYLASCIGIDVIPSLYTSYC